jgi:hypothetical protein
LEVLFEDVVARAITTPAITGHQDRSSVWIMVFTVGVPPVSKAVTGEFTGNRSLPSVNQRQMV